MDTQWSLAGSRRRTGILCLLLVAGVLPLAGCALSGDSLGENRLARKMRRTADPASAVAQDTSASRPKILPLSPDHDSGPKIAANSQLPDAPLPPPTVAEPRPEPSRSDIQLVSAEAPVPASPPPQAEPPKAIRAETPHPQPAMPRRVLHVNQATFDRQVLHAEGPVLVDFSATWCGPCKLLSPTLDEIAAETRAMVVKIDIDDSPELAARYGVKSVPTLLVIKGGRVVAKQKGLTSKSRLMSMLDL